MGLNSDDVVFFSLSIYGGGDYNAILFIFYLLLKRLC